MRTLFAVALADLRHEWSVSVAACLAIAAVTAPLVVLLALREGVVGELFGHLRADPAVRLVTLDATGAARFDAAWFERMSAQRQVGFVHPATRFAAAEVQLGSSGKEERASLLPTAAGDPVFASALPPLDSPFAIALSHDLAGRLRAGVGDRLTMAFERTAASGRVEPRVLDVEVVAIAPVRSFQGRAAFVRFDLLLAIEAFRDGFAAPLIGVNGGDVRPERTFYPNFRLYARELEDVAPLVAQLSAAGLSVSSQSARIATNLQLDANLRLVITALVALGAVGLAGGLAAIQWSLSARKRRTVAVFGLIGFGRVWLVGLPVLQALLLAWAGAVLSLAAAAAFGFWINAHLAASFGASGRAFALTWPVVAGCVLALTVISLVPALRIGLTFAALEPAHEIRDG